jgi:integrase/recombinase XerC
LGTELATAAPTAAIAAPLRLDADGVRRLEEAWLAGRNENTRRAYAQTAADFAAYLTRRAGQAYAPAQALEALLRAGAGAANLLVLEYRADLLERKLAPSTVALRLSGLRAAVKLARILGLVEWTLEIPAGKSGGAYRDTRGPGRAAVREMMRSLSSRADPAAVRDFAVLRLLYDLGLRRFELAGLDLEHVDLEGKRVAVLRKGKAQRTWLSTPAATVRALEAWLLVRGREPGPLFLGLRGPGRGQRLEVSGVYRAVRRMGLDVGVTTRTHGLRHTAITEAVKRAQACGIGLDEVRDFSGHADVRTLLVYRDRERDVQGRIAELVAEDE